MHIIDNKNSSTYLITLCRVFARKNVFPYIKFGAEQEGGGEGSGEHEGKARGKKGLTVGQLSLPLVDDESVSVQGNEKDGEGVEEDADGLACSCKLAQDLHLWSPRPKL